MGEANDGFTVLATALGTEDNSGASWAVYVMRIGPGEHNDRPLLKVGMVGTATVEQRRQQHAQTYGEAALIIGWTLADQIKGLSVDDRWKVVEQYEARLQFAPEFAHPDAQLRHLRPDTNGYSFEWFVHDQRVLDALEAMALRPLTLPVGWQIGDAARPTEGPGEAAIVPPAQP